MAERELSRAARWRAGGARTDEWLEAAVIAAAVALVGFALREFLAPDYRAEQLAAFRSFADHGFNHFFDALPGYPGAMLVELLAAGPAALLGASDALIWRIVSVFGVGVLAAALLAAASAMRATELSRSGARLALVLAAASPAAYWALRIGHPEEVLSTGLLLGATLAAARERPVIAGVLLGLAVGKAWPVVAALPVLGLLLPNTRRLAIGAASAFVAAALITVPAFVFAPTAVETLASTGKATIFNTGQLWWWFGTPIEMSAVGLQDVPQPRVGPAWTGELSHPLIVGVGTAIGLVWCWTVLQRLHRLPQISVAALRGHGETRSREFAAELASSALLTMAGILLLRCYLDTWNVPYYILPALVCGAVGEALSGRRPIMTLVMTGLMWKFHSPGDYSIREHPDVYTAFYLAWVIPFSAAYLVMGLRAARELGATALRGAARPAAGAERTWGSGGPDEDASAAPPVAAR